MSEYQFYAFQAIDAPLDAAAQRALRAISSRARITATSFTNHYEWGDFKGDPRKLMERWFDLHLYLANWGARRLMMRLPVRLLDRAAIAPFLDDVDWVGVWEKDGRLVVDIVRQTEDGPDYDAYDDAGGEDGDGARLGELAPLRADVASGDLRLFYLVWLVAVQDGDVDDDVREPLPGIGEPVPALLTFADFLRLDPDLVRAAAERGHSAPSAGVIDRAVAALSEAEKTALLLRVAAGDAGVAAELRRRARTLDPATSSSRTAGALRERAREITEAREREAAAQREEERKRKEAAARQAQRMRFDGLRRRGEAVWREIDAEIARRNPKGYDNASGLLSDMQALAAEDGDGAAFDRRIAVIRATHATKGRFIERLDKLGLNGGDRRGR